MNPARSGEASFAAEKRSVCRGWERGSSDPRKSAIPEKNGQAGTVICGSEDEEPAVRRMGMRQEVCGLSSSVRSRLRL